MMAIQEFDEEIVTLLRNRAKDVLLTRAIASEESLVREPAQDLLEMDGMDETLAFSLARNGVATMDELAELSVDELTEMAGIDAERAAAMIMKAREPWFAEAENE
jgi:N utilization substance protein A